MIAVISPSTLSGNVVAAASKSAMQRACALGLMHTGETYIHNPGKSNDDLAALEIIGKLGTFPEHTSSGSIHIKSTGRIHATGEINCGESGLSLRMFAPIAALSTGEVTLTGTGSLLNRPMNFLDKVLPLLDVEIKSNNGKLPLLIKGPLQPKNISIDGSQSSQYLTGLLFAFAHSAIKRVSIKVDNLKSKPYIDLSMEMMDHFGYDVINNNYEEFIIIPVKRQEKEIEYYTEGDWSGAAFLLVAGAIAGSIIVSGLNSNSSQADRSILEVLITCGADIQVGDVINISNKNRLQSFTFNATDSPDLFPPLAVLATHCEGTSIITGVSRLAEKESDRGKTLVDIFSKMGIHIRIENDNLIIEGGSVKESTIDSHHDHRIAMAGAIAALNATGRVTISNADAVNKSYPAFYDHLKCLGAGVYLNE